MIQVVPALARAKMNTMAAIRPRISPAPVSVAYPVSPDTWLAGYGTSRRGLVISSPAAVGTSRPA
jgi:hypothetical protein